MINACKVVNQDMLTEYTARNNSALNDLLIKHKVDMRRLPEDVLMKLRGLSEEVVIELANKDKRAKRIYKSYDDFRKQVINWHKISEQAYYNVRSS